MLFLLDINFLQRVFNNNNNKQRNLKQNKKEEIRNADEQSPRFNF